MVPHTLLLVVRPLYWHYCLDANRSVEAPGQVVNLVMVVQELLNHSSDSLQLGRTAALPADSL